MCAPYRLLASILLISESVLFSKAALSGTLSTDLAISVYGASREFAYTNKKAAFLYGETNGEQRSSWQGFNVWGREMLDSYSLLIDGVSLLPQSATRVVVFPDHLERYYPSGIVEEVRPVDSLDLFAVIVRAPHPQEISFLPWFTDIRRKEDAVLDLRQECTLIARTTQLEHGTANPAPSWLAIAGDESLPLLRETKDRGRYSPFLLTSTRSRCRMFVIAAARTREDAEYLAKTFPLHAERAFAERRLRMDRLLARSFVKTGNARFDAALAWAKISLDALMMEQGKPGIFAGLPWFNNYWGRDTFIALPGATLATGRFHEAREILLSFADFQERDSSSTNFGRIPNFVTPTDRAYNTADATPRFVVTAREYIERSGDKSILPLLYPVVVRSIEGTRRSHIDSLGLLTHMDAETWMDAVGPDGPWSPRGNRASDIQALWTAQLEAGVWFATQVGDAEAARSWFLLREQVIRNFRRLFIQNGRLADRIAADGTPDMSPRPNQIFTAPLLDEQTRSSVLRTVVGTLTYPYGVASLSQTDERFHPYHQHPPFYPKDAAYHNGTVWTWLQGPVISELCRIGGQNLAWQVTANSVHQILEKGAVGTQSELLDALPHPGKEEPDRSGTFSQAWNLAEFVRNFYDDYLGLQVNLLDRSILFRPNVPDSLGSVSAGLTLEGSRVSVQTNNNHGLRTLRIQTERGRGSWKAVARLRVTGRKSLEISYMQPASATVTLSVRGDSLVAWEGCPTIPRVVLTAGPPAYIELDSLHLVKPSLQENLPSLRGPGYPLLSNETIKRSASGARVILDASDPEGDDVGIVQGTRYTYPQNPAFVPGSFDIRSFRVQRDSELAYFHLQFPSLPDPGWHPEYGFQLTYAAIAIDVDNLPGSGATEIPMNASVRLSSRHAYDRLILVGGGVSVEDARGRILAAYLPVPDDVRNPLGNAQNGTIDFALPLSVLGTPSPGWQFTVYVGGQDDHGGAGIGEFRTVNRTAGQWNGGGKLRPEDPNVFDVLEATVR